MSETRALYRGDISRSIPQYRSKTEAAWARVSLLHMQGWLEVPVLLEMYEPMSFKLPGGSYTPDFLYLLEDGRLVFVEVKGSRKQRNYRDARSKLRAARELYPWFVWCEVRKAGRAWEFEELK